ncbi:MAG: carbamoyltransferase HypF, partial [Candidatus Omnitrophica bacterium]|nr:carbamoyltransferase HypF [Candidatus Omnitrophota bacterium]
MFLYQAGMKAVSINLRGRLQGVGFRPWVFCLAQELGLKGFVQNTSYGAYIEMEGAPIVLESFMKALREKTPTHCLITEMFMKDILWQGFEQFQILTSQDKDEHKALVLPDIATCADCIHEIFDPANRRYLYPLTNCTHCGPRYSIIEHLPYDRAHTTMKGFVMCPQCQAEYDNPKDRRFHAQPNACPVCGPQVMLLDNQGKLLFEASHAVDTAVDFIKQGHIVAVKGIGGFHLMADALNEKAVELLRHRKARWYKPLALMMPSVEITKKYVRVSVLEEQTLQSSSAPIVLLSKLEKVTKIAESV